MAGLVWERFGDSPNYVEPFAGSLAVLLNRPHAPSTETVNDLDCYLANFWRAIQYDPVEVARWADAPVNEADLLARHRWLLSTGAERVAALRSNPDHYDPKVAGWWVWGLCSWIGSGWCRNESAQLPHLGSAGQGIHRKLPHLGDAGQGLLDYFQALADRLRRVRVACGAWDRVLGESVTVKHGMTAVFLDPPYSAEEHDVTYSADSDVSAEVRAWAVANGSNSLYRIALCGYAGEHAMPHDWAEVAWKAHGGFGSQSDGRGRLNSERERIWFSPHCLPAYAEQEVLDLR